MQDVICSFIPILSRSTYKKSISLKTTEHIMLPYLISTHNSWLVNKSLFIFLNSALNNLKKIIYVNLFNNNMVVVSFYETTRPVQPQALPYSDSFWKLLSTEKKLDLHNYLRRNKNNFQFWMNFWFARQVQRMCHRQVNPDCCNDIFHLKIYFKFKDRLFVVSWFLKEIFQRVSWENVVN